LAAIGIVPYTLFFMVPTNNKLFAKVEEVRGLKAEDTVVEIGLGGETAHQLLDWWGVLNLGRGALLATSGVLGLWLSLK